MKINCEKCKNEVVKIEFSEKQKLDIYVLMQNDLKVFVEKKLVNEFNLDKNEAKIIIQHLNNRNGKCPECDFDKLEGEYIKCNNCGAFNYNLDEPIFNMEFCVNLPSINPFFLSHSDCISSSVPPLFLIISA